MYPASARTKKAALGQAARDAAAALNIVIPTPESTSSQVEGGIDDSDGEDGDDEMAVESVTDHSTLRKGNGK